MRYSSFISHGLHTVHGYKLKSDSPGIDAGAFIKDNGGRDFFNNKVPYNNRIDIGIHEYQDQSDKTPPKPIKKSSKNKLLYHDDFEKPLDNWLIEQQPG